jgi:ribose transport system substrate-binding protein
MSTTRTTRRRGRVLAPVAVLSVAFLAACTSNAPAEEEDTGAEAAPVAVSDNDAPGDPIVIGFSAPAADHGWMGAITTAAEAEAAEYEDVELRVADGTNDVNVQISQIEGFINDGVDAIVLLPFDGAALTEVATKAMEAGIPVINVDREFSSPFAARTTVLGDNYGMGVSAGTYICEQLGDNPDAVIAEIPGIDSLPLTQDRSAGFADALEDCGLEVSARVAADFTVQGGEAAASQLLSANPQIDALWNHDDDQGIGVLAAANTANRKEYIMVGGAGSLKAMQDIQADNTVLKATVTYSPSMASSAISLARLIAQGKGMADLVELQVPKEIILASETITKENAANYLKLGF